MKKLALASALAAICITALAAEPMVERDPYGSGYGYGYKSGPGKGGGPGMYRPSPTIPRIPNAIPPHTHERPDEFLADLQIGQPADYREPGKLVIISGVEKTDLVPYRISRIAPDFIELEAKGSRIRLRGSAISAIYTYDDPEAAKAAFKKGTE